ncbi:hypothetical protein [Nocardioides perillae]|uniref:CHAT domain-containing protein n=1 Tax=Nocardioides perillae TaxID=1119534 RepID=A0A7Y9ULD6_9ACTN|nr:hypothetical protein [Nocardioides perillae]NYG54957.1 hypothetical protein [Nocardioides perillae]
MINFWEGIVLRNRLVTLLDLGLDESFNAAMAFVQGVLSNVNAGYTVPHLDVDFVRSRDPLTIQGAISSRCDVLHVMAHGDHSASPSFVSSDGATEVDLGVLAEGLARGLDGIAGGAVVIADGCKTGIGIWQRAIRDCLEGEITYIGTTANIGWHESTVFCSAFYGSLLRDRGRGRSAAQQGMDAAERAAKAYEVLTDRKCPFRVSTLTPSSRAKRAIRGANG